MDLDTIEMDREEARKAFSEYRAAVRKRHDAEGEAIMRGYRALAQGHQLIRLRQVIQAGGVDERGLPRLAVMRADEPWCWVQRSYQGDVSFAFERYPSSNRKTGVYRFPEGTLDLQGGRVYQSGLWWWNLRAIVPSVPPALRPAHALGHLSRVGVPVVRRGGDSTPPFSPPRGGGSTPPFSQVRGGGSAPPLNDKRGGDSPPKGGVMRNLKGGPVSTTPAPSLLDAAPRPRRAPERTE
ncbi:MAG: hypothetical protein ABR540_10750 [Acidimicrobiales bacterium]